MPHVSIRDGVTAGRGSRAITSLPSTERGPLRLGIMEEDWEGLQMGASKGAVGQVAMEGGGHWGSLEFLEDTRVGCWVSSGRARTDEGRDVEEVPGSEGSDCGPGPP